MKSRNFSRWPRFSGEEVEAVADVLLSNRVNYWTGDQCHLFESEFAEWCGVEHAVSLANGTAALEAALTALKVGPGDEVVVSPRTFIASVSSIVLAGATPVFADVDPDTQNVTADTISQVLTDRTKSIVCVHLAGVPCDMDPILELAGRYSLSIIEDCAQAHGALYKGRSVGSIGDIGAWSFCQDKILTTGGEGGMVTTNSKELWSAMWSYKDHGKDWEASKDRQARRSFAWVHHSFGKNFRMLEMQAAIGRIQLRKLPEWSRRRNEIAQKFLAACAKHRSVRVPAAPKGVVNANYLAYAFVQPDNLADGWSRDRIVDEISRRGASCFVGSCPEVYLEKAFDLTDFRPKKSLPVARHLGETSLAFLVHPTLTDSEVMAICSILDDVLADASS